MVESTSLMTQPPKLSTFQLLLNLRISNAIVPSGLILLGLFWNNLAGFGLGYLFLIFSTFFGNVFVFVVNDYYDTDADLEDPLKRMRNVFCSPTTKKAGIQALFLSVLLSMVFAALISVKIFIIMGILNGVYFFYSAPPVRLRDRMLWDWIFVILWKGLIIIAGYVYIFAWTWFGNEPFIYGTLFLFLTITMIGQITINQLSDFEVDKKTNKTNTVQMLGRHRAVLVYKVLFVLFFATGVVISVYYRLYITLGLICANLALFYFVKQEKRQYILDYSLIWVVILFVERYLYLGVYNIYAQVLSGTWVVAMIGIAVIHARRKGLI